MDNLAAFSIPVLNRAVRPRPRPFPLHALINAFAQLNELLKALLFGHDISLPAKTIDQRPARMIA